MSEGHITAMQAYPAGARENTRPRGRNLKNGPRGCVEQLAGAERGAALRQLVELGNAAFEAVREDLREGLRDGRWQVRKGCSQALYAVGDGSSFGALMPLLRDPKADVRVWAMHALAGECARSASHVQELVRLLVERVELDRSVRARHTAAQLLAAHPLDGHTRALFLRLREDHDDKLRQLACWVLSRGGVR